jgi:uncharacterized iron-regulated membrane protein
MRRILVLMHRYAGLVTALFLLIASLTGSLMAWNDELETLISPQLFLAKPPAPGAAMLDPLQLRDLVQAQYRATFVPRVQLKQEAGRSVQFRLYALPDPKTGKTPELANDEVFVNPYTGAVQGERKFGALSQGLVNLMPFICSLHYSLALGVAGTLLFGVVALLWSIDCLVSIFLTFPARARSANAAPWPRRWLPSWQVRWRGGQYKVYFDLHRAGGLWLWAALFVMAWSSVSFNLRPVYDPLMRTLLAHQQDMPAPRLAKPLLRPPINWQQARTMARQSMMQHAQQRGFRIIGEYMLIYNPLIGQYAYYVQTDLDVSQRWGLTHINIDASSGAQSGVWLPTGGAAGDTFSTWITTLHMAARWGVPMQLFMTVFGFAIAMLSVTGVWIWARKRRSRHVAASRVTTVAAPPGAA